MAEMRQRQETVTVRTAGRGFTDVTERVAAVVAAADVRTGLCTVLCRHTSASLLVTENADPAVRRDLMRWLERVAPEAGPGAGAGPAWEHDAEGPDDMPAHARSALLRTSESVPVTDGRLALGTWQGIYLVEHRAAGHRRELVVHVLGA
jgi:secondary thiamine-phosphate synthase enzyme